MQYSHNHHVTHADIFCKRNANSIIYQIIAYRFLFVCAASLLQIEIRDLPLVFFFFLEFPPFISKSWWDCHSISIRRIFVFMCNFNSFFSLSFSFDFLFVVSLPLAHFFLFHFYRFQHLTIRRTMCVFVYGWLFLEPKTSSSFLFFFSNGRRFLFALMCDANNFCSVFYG